MTAETAALVKAQLRKQGINASKVKKPAFSIGGGAKKKKITPFDIAIFVRQLATMMSSATLDKSPDLLKVLE